MTDAEQWDHYLRGGGPGDYRAWRRAWTYLASRRVRFGVYAHHPAPRVVRELHLRRVLAWARRPDGTRVPFIIEPRA